jgi:pyridoxamine 5'-phosphate oxidase
MLLMSLVDPEPTKARPVLRESDVPGDPISLFRSWWAHALAARLIMPEAMTLATATRSGEPSARLVLLRGVDDRGFVFFTNYDSRKGRELAENPRAALVLYWAELERQVRIEGAVELVSASESDVYFQTRPRGSQLGAWVSPQSEVISGREFLEKRMKELTTQHAGGPVPRPPHWGGYRVIPDMVEFWQGQENRLHDRLRYRRAEGGGWVLERLAP